MNHPKAIVHLDRLARNYKILSNSVNGKRLMAVVKANAYGHGSIECSKKLEDQGCDFFSVFTVEEAGERCDPTSLAKCFSKLSKKVSFCGRHPSTSKKCA